MQGDISSRRIKEIAGTPLSSQALPELDLLSLQADAQINFRLAIFGHLEADRIRPALQAIIPGCCAFHQLVLAVRCAEA